MLHYYLFSGERFSLLEKTKKYVYYLVPIDYAIAWFLMGSPKKEKLNNEKPGDDSDSDDESIGSGSGKSARSTSSDRFATQGGKGQPRQSNPNAGSTRQYTKEQIQAINENLRRSKNLQREHHESQRKNLFAKTDDEPRSSHKQSKHGKHDESDTEESDTPPKRRPHKKHETNESSNPRDKKKKIEKENDLLKKRLLELEASKKRDAEQAEHSREREVTQTRDPEDTSLPVYDE